MIPKTVSRPTPTSSQPHSHYQSEKSKMALRTSTTPYTPSSRIPPSVGQALPPNSALLTSQAEVKTPSPNYFGLIVDPTSDPRNSAAGPQRNWSPSSSIGSFGAQTPKHIPLDANPEFELFRRQSEGAKGFSLGHGGNLSHFASTPGPRPKPDRRPTRPETPISLPPMLRGSQGDATPEWMDIDGGKGAASATKARSALNAQSFFDVPRQESPGPMNPPTTQRDALSHLDDRHPRLSLPINKANPPSPQLKLPQKNTHLRADTLPTALEDGPSMIPTSQLRDILASVRPSEYLLLDLRTSTNFAVSRIRGALNLNLPTTLLKRPSFNLEKLRDTFSNKADQEQFMRWKTAKYIIVYDASSFEKKDALSSVNTLKKFITEGWQGTCYIVRGGFADVAKNFPQLIDTTSAQDKQPSKVSLSLGTAPEVAPVAGGCAMPAFKSAANPFFGNIRQNQDLVDGVGQMDVKLPESLTKAVLPKWLSEISREEDHGKMLADKFLKIELDEQARMQKALMPNVTYGTPGMDSKVQLAGIEKGGKNRYKDILPFEHARVKLQNKPANTCDYVNASYIRPSRSNKRYIASQGPLPATFEDFWSVIWDQDVRVIVMLTAEKEGGSLKCHPYWNTQNLGPLRLKNLSERKVSLVPKKYRTFDKTSRSNSSEVGRRRATTISESASQNASPPPPDVPFAIVRKFTLAHSDHPFLPIREITQVHYSSWPDFGAPQSADQLLSLVELSNLMQRAASSSTQSPRSDDPELNQAPRPILVHCSAGCGRTGTFCTIDSVIDMLKRQRKEITHGTTPMEGMSAPGGDYLGKGKKPGAAVEGDWIFSSDVDLVEKTVEDFRGQRLSMVQTLRQFVLCYETVLEWIAQETSGPSSKHPRPRSGSAGHMDMIRRKSSGVSSTGSTL